MLVREHMTPDPISVGQDASIVEAAKLMKEKEVRRFPVLRGNELIGIVTDRDLRSAAPSEVISFDAEERQLMPELHDLLAKVKIKDVMSREVVTVGPDQTIVAAAQLMLEHRISGIPVADSQGRMLGIITETDIFKVLVDASGLSSGKTTFALHLEDRTGSIKQVADVIRAHGARLAGLFTSYALADPQFRRVYIRIGDLPAEKLQALEQELRGQFEVLYVAHDDVTAA
jgi:acetoin utilization protein AcuB